MRSWAAEELRYAKLGDARLNRRLIRIVEDVAAQPTVSVPQASGTWAATKGVYRFWDSEQITPEAIRASHVASTVERVQGQEVVLAVQDTTGLDFAHHRATQGLGPLDNAYQRGLKVHSCLAESTQGVPLGLLHQAVWARDPERVGVRHQRRKRETKDKESQRWLTALQASQEAVPAEVQVVTVADSEADIYDLFALSRRPGSHLLIRGTHNRRVDHTAAYLWQAAGQGPVCGEYTLPVRRKDGRPARQARLSVRYCSLEIQPPRNRKQRASLPAVRLQVVLVVEQVPSAGVTPICWLLLTTLALHTLEDALRCARWYSYRWLIETAFLLVKRLLDLAYLWVGSLNGVQLQVWATFLSYAILIDLCDELAEQLHLPLDRISVEMVYRSLYFYAHAVSQGYTERAAVYLAAEAYELGIVKRQRARAGPTLVEQVQHALVATVSLPDA